MTQGELSSTLVRKVQKKYDLLYYNIFLGNFNKKNYSLFFNYIVYKYEI